MSFKKAVKYGAKLRMALAGPAGAGKTWTALTLATALADGGEIALIDTERGSASKYADVFQFDVMELDTFHPDRFVAGIKEAEQAGYAVLIIDSLSHAWNGPGGLLELVEQITKRSNSKNSFNAWGEATPIHQRLVDALTRANMHIIVTMRSKTEYVVELINGKSTPRKIGMAPIQRDGLEYEFDVFADLDHDNTLIVQKTRCPVLSGAVIAKPDAKMADILKAWLDGTPAPVQEPVLDIMAVYEAGKANGTWIRETFYATASTLLGMPVNQGNYKLLPAAKVRTLQEAVEQEQAKPATEQAQEVA
jgi:AAA domain